MGQETSRESPFSWRIDSLPNTLENEYEQWNDLAQRSGAIATAYPMWYASIYEAFGELHGPIFVHRLYHQSQLIAVLPLVLKGRIFKTWYPYQNSLYTPIWAFPYDEHYAESEKEICKYLFEQASTLDIRFVLQKSNSIEKLIKTSDLYRIIIENYPAEADIFNPLNRNWDQCVGHLSKKLKKNTEQSIRRLRKQGSLDMSVLTDSDDLESTLNECFKLEKAGWKGRIGTAILCLPEVETFYRHLAIRAAENGSLAIYTLRLNGKLIAFKLCLRAANRIEILKIAYDESLAKESPGNILAYMILYKECHEGKFISLHWGAPDTPEQAAYKTRWSDCINPLIRVLIFDNSLTGALNYFLFKYVRPVFRSLTRWLKDNVQKSHNTKKDLIENPI